MLQPQKPFSPSCEENKQVILDIIQPYLTSCKTLLEVGSGTGQHAVFMGQKMPHLAWQTSDLVDNHAGIQLWLKEAQLPNVHPPLALNVSTDTWPQHTYDAVYSANSFHIMAKHHVIDFFSNLPLVLQNNSLVMIYGPFNINGCFTSDSNARFNDWLTARDPHSGIKDLEWCDALALQAGLTLKENFAMPQNNRLLLWQKMTTT